MTVHYAIVGTPRTGGNLLCDVLTHWGYGEPGEHLGPQHRDRQPLLPWLRHEHAILRPGQRWAVKAHWSELVQYGITVDDLLPDTGTQRWVHLWRRDVEAQAESLIVARRYGLWRTSSHGHVDDFEVDWWVAELHRRNAMWHAAMHGRDVMSISYEELCQGVDGFRRVAGFLGDPDMPTLYEPHSRTW